MSTGGSSGTRPSCSAVAGRRGSGGRAAAFLGISGQALFDYSEMRLQIYVDDPLSAWVGDEATVRRNQVVLLLWWLTAGPPISWGKLQRGRTVKWIGVQLAAEGARLQVALTEGFVQLWGDEIQSAAQLSAIPQGQLRRLAGRGSWAAGVVPYLKAMLAPLGRKAVKARTACKGILATLGRKA